MKRLPDNPVAPNRKFMENILPWQKEVLTDIDTLDGIRFFLLEVHRRARKTTTVINLLNRECVRYPNTRRIYISPTYAQSRSIVWDDPNMLRSYLPDQNIMPWKASEQRMQVRYGNNSVLELHGSDDPDRLRGIDFEDAGIDEAAVVAEPVLTEILMPILFQKPGRRLFIMYTPKGNSWCTRMFDLAADIQNGYELPINGRSIGRKDEYYAYRMLATESHIIPDAELAMAKATMPKPIFEQEFLCRRATEEAMTLITSEMVDSLDPDPPQEGDRAVIAIDPSMGGDECSMDAHIGNRIAERCSLRTKDWNLIYARARQMSDQHHIYDFAVDSIGIGQAIVVLLRQDERYQVMEVNSAESSTDPTRFANIRAEMYWFAMEEMRRYGVQRPKDEETRRELPYASRYRQSQRGAIQIIPKDEIRKVLGRSPDRADSFVMARFMLPRARIYTGDRTEFQQVIRHSGNQIVKNPDIFRRNRFYGLATRRR